jgi:transcriptional regulator with XRE-family HTH domain
MLRVVEPGTVTLREVLGANCRRIRTDAAVTQSALARCACLTGLNWRTSSVADFEAGRSEPTMKTVIAVCLALGVATGKVVELADMVLFDGFVAVTEQLEPTGEWLAGFCAGKRRPLTAADARHTASAERLDELHAPAPGRFGKYGMRATDVEEMRRMSGLDEYRMAKRLSIDDDRLLAESFRLWQRTLSQERDRRAGPAANQQRRGRISRELRAQLEEALTRGDD